MRFGFPFRDRAGIIAPPAECVDFIAAAYDNGAGLRLHSHAVITSPATWSDSLANFPTRLVPTDWQLTPETADAGVLVWAFTGDVLHYDRFGTPLWTWEPPAQVYDAAWHFSDRTAIIPVMNGDEVDVWTINLAGSPTLRFTVDPGDASLSAGIIVSCTVHLIGYLFLLHIDSSSNAATVICVDYDTGDIQWSLPVSSGASQFNELSWLRRGAESGDLFVAVAENDGTHDQVVVQRHFFAGNAFYDPPSLVWDETVTDGARDHLVTAFHTRWDGVFVGYSMNAEGDAHVATALNRVDGATLFTAGPSTAVEFTEPTCVGLATSINNQALIAAVADDVEDEATVQQLRVLDLLDDGALLSTVPVEFVGPVATVLCPIIIPNT